MALIVEGISTNKITTAKPKAVIAPVKTISGYVPTTVVKTAAPTPVATVSRSSGGSGTPTPTRQTTSPVSTVSSTTNKGGGGIAIPAPKGGGGVAIPTDAKLAQAKAQETLAKQIQTMKEAQSAQLGVFGKETEVTAKAVRAAIQDTGVQASSEAIVKGVQDLQALKGESKVDIGALISGQAQPQNADEQAILTSAQEYLNGLKTLPTAENIGQFSPIDSAMDGKTEEAQAQTAPTTGQTGSQTISTGIQEYGTPGAGETGAVAYGTGDMSGMFADPIGSFMSGNPYWDQLASMKFEYDPATDPEYINGSAILENQVAQMMVGRGGLYSSVNQAALSTKLIEFQIALRKQKYEQYQEDRSFMLNMAKTVWDRQAQVFSQTMQVKEYELNIAKMDFDQKMTIAKFNADREDAAFSKSMQQQSLNLQRQNAALSQAKAIADINAANSANDLNGLVSNIKYTQSMYDKMYDEWKRTGSASNEVAAFFGCSPTTKFGFPAQKYTTAKVNQINQLSSQATVLARDLNELDIMQAGLQGFMTEDVAPMTEVKYSSTEEDLLGNKVTKSWTGYEQVGAQTTSEQEKTWADYK